MKQKGDAQQICASPFLRNCGRREEPAFCCGAMLFFCVPLWYNGSDLRRVGGFQGPRGTTLRRNRTYRQEKMRIKGIVFDIGQTLAFYPIPLNWSALYRPAFESIAEKNRLQITEREYTHIGEVLSKYNTRIHPREREVSSDTIFREILGGTNIPTVCQESIKRDFYSFFRREVRVYDDVPETLKALKAKGIMTGTFSDVPYGMDNSYAFADIAEVLDYIDFPFTSNDAGYRKPNRKGLEILAGRMKIRTSEMIFAGDEKKDVECALNAGATAVLINRDEKEKDFGQDYTIRNFGELLKITG